MSRVYNGHFRDGMIIVHFQQSIYFAQVHILKKNFQLFWTSLNSIYIYIEGVDGFGVTALTFGKLPAMLSKLPPTPIQVTTLEDR